MHTRPCADRGDARALASHEAVLDHAELAHRRAAPHRVAGQREHARVDHGEGPHAGKGIRAASMTACA
jgi:hypothetical protein